MTVMKWKEIQIDFKKEKKEPAAFNRNSHASQFIWQFILHIVMICFALRGIQISSLLLWSVTEMIKNMIS